MVQERSAEYHSDLGIDRATLRRLAVEADADPRSVIAELRACRGERPHVRGMSGHRVRRVLREHGLIAPEVAA
jgi:hypothetical protein